MAPSFVLVVGALSCGKAEPGGDETGEAGGDSVQAGSTTGGGGVGTAGSYNPPLVFGGTGGASPSGGNLGTGGSNPPQPMCPAPAPPPANGAACAVWIVSPYMCTFNAECGAVLGTCAGGQWDLPGCGAGGAGGEGSAGGQGGAAL